MIIINDNDTCNICGAYFQGNGYCTNGHLKQNKMKNNNKLIAEFMGYVTHNPEWQPMQFKDEEGFWSDIDVFETSWNRLMPVVSKITRDEEYRGNHCREHLMDIVPYGHIEDTYDAVVDFIREYRLTPKEVV